MVEANAYVIAISDSPLSPLASVADAAFTVSAVGTGPFDSHVVTLALIQALIADAARHLVASAAERLDRVERIESDAGVDR